MITQALLHLGSLIGSWVGTLFPQWSPPAQFTGLGDQLSGLFAGVNGVGVWVPVSVILIAGGLALGTWVVCFGIKLVRALIAHVPLAGGAG